MSNQELKGLIIQRRKLQKERDDLGGGFDMGNPMAMVSRLGDLQKVVELSKEVEALSDQIIQSTITMIQEQEAG